jgi:starvation-inducible DNA-binding protein
MNSAASAWQWRPTWLETTQIKRPPRGREEAPVQLSRLLDAHKVIIGECRTLEHRASALGDNNTNDLVVSRVLCISELQAWFLGEHLVNVPVVKAKEPFPAVDAT